MKSLTLTGLTESGNSVTQDMFGVNAVYAQTQGGLPDATFTEVANTLSIHNLRFGGGQADVNPDAPVIEGVTPVDGVDWINTIKLVDGALRPELVTFFEWCRDQAEATGVATKATLIVPTHALSSDELAATADDIARFAELVMRDYSDLVEAFELGNEHWGMGEADYGAKASVAAEALAIGMADAGVAEADQPPILVQMATAGNAGSLFPATPGVNDFVARNNAANEMIIDALSDEARDAIDGVVEHYYFKKSHLEFTGASSEKSYINRDLAVWEEAFDKDLEFHVTEWNIKTTTTSQQGMVAGSTFIEQFENMIELGADAAHVWAIDHHTKTTLTLDTDEGVRLDEAGRVTNSIQGALFDMMADTLVGKELLFSEFENSTGSIEINSYGDAEELVFYVSSRSFEVQDVQLDLSAFAATGASVTAVQVVMDAESSNGLQWENGIAADSVLVDGEAYFYNEHDVDVNLIDLTFDSVADIDLVLKPFEVVQITVDRAVPSLQRADVRSINGDDDDVIQFSDDMSVVDGGGGLDFLVMEANAADVAVVAGDANTATMTPDWLSGDVYLKDVERISFDDGTLAFDADGNAGEAYRLYQACFDRTPDAEGLGFWIGNLDSGAIDLAGMANQFIGSTEFQLLYGTPGTMADDAFLTLLYQNVLDRDPDQGGFDFWRTQQEAGMSRAEMLVYFSESTENVNLTAPAMDDGIWYI